MGLNLFKNLVQKTLPKLVVIIWFGLVQIFLAVNLSVQVGRQYTAKLSRAAAAAWGGTELGNCEYGMGWIIGDYNNLAWQQEKLTL